MRGIHLAARSRAAADAQDRRRLHQPARDPGDCQRFVEDELGVPFKYDSMINPRIRLLAEPAGGTASRRKSASRSISPIPNAATSGSRSRRKCAKPSKPKPLQATVYHAGGGLSSFAIDP